MIIHSKINLLVYEEAHGIGQKKGDMSTKIEKCSNQLKTPDYISQLRQNQELEVIKA